MHNCQPPEPILLLQMLLNVAKMCFHPLSNNQLISPKLAEIWDLMMGGLFTLLHFLTPSHRKKDTKIVY